MTMINHLLKLRQTRQDAADTLKARYSFEARIAYDNAARAFEYALNVAAEDLLKLVEAHHALAGQSHDAGLLAALEALVNALAANDEDGMTEFADVMVNARAAILQAKEPTKA